MDAYGLTLDPSTGEVFGLEQFSQAISKRGLQVEASRARLTDQWEQVHLGETMSRAVAGRIRHQAAEVN